MSNCCTTCLQPIQPYRIVRTIKERNAIPCEERMDGMLVLVIEDSYTRYVMKGGNNYCNNLNWKKDTISDEDLVLKIGHVTEDVEVSEPIESEYLNNKYPTALEGFRVTVEPLNTTFQKVSRNRWSIIANFLNDE